MNLFLSRLNLIIICLLMCYVIEGYVIEGTYERCDSLSLPTAPKIVVNVISESWPTKRGIKS